MLLRWYQQLYDIEDRGKELSTDERLALREQEAKPIWDELAAWLDEVKLRTAQVILPKSDFGKALQHIRNHFQELQRYLSNGHLPIDNNQTEQLMKQVMLDDDIAAVSPSSRPTFGRCPSRFEAGESTRS